MEPRFGEIGKAACFLLNRIAVRPLEHAGARSAELTPFIAAEMGCACYAVPHRDRGRQANARIQADYERASMVPRVGAPGEHWLRSDVRCRGLQRRVGHKVWPLLAPAAAARWQRGGSFHGWWSRAVS